MRKTIQDFPAYSVDIDGNIYSNKTGRKLKARLNHACGYLRVGLRRDGKQHWKRVHRLVLETFIGPCPVGYVGRHLNDIPIDNRLDNLQWGTQAENIKDRKNNNTSRLFFMYCATHHPEIIQLFLKTKRFVKK